MTDHTPSHRAARCPAAITGMGMLTPLGNDFASVGDALMAGRSGVREIDLLDASRTLRQFAAPVEAIPDLPELQPRQLGRGDNVHASRLERLCGAAAVAAVDDCGAAAAAGRRVGLVLGIGA